MKSILEVKQESVLSFIRWMLSTRDGIFSFTKMNDALIECSLKRLVHRTSVSFTSFRNIRALFHSSIFWLRV